MSLWAIGYDLDVGAMKAAGKTESQVTAFYTEVRKCLSTNGFEKFKQLSVYTSDKPNTLTNAFKACQALKGVTGADTFIKRLHLFRIEDHSDLLPLVSGRESADRDAVEESIKQVFSKTGPGDSVAASPDKKSA